MCSKNILKYTPFYFMVGIEELYSNHVKPLIFLY
jgi:hypothetical protein